MSQSLVKNYVHIVFSTKNRQPLIMLQHADNLYQYIAGICTNLECHALKIGGYNDHVHILCLLSKNIALVDLIEDIKARSSKWIKTKEASLVNFYWQHGYGAFSVTPSQIGIVSEYIANQQEHHQQKTFQDEYRSFLKKYKVDYDERYVWD